jgi:hypothetical protein
MRSLKSSSISLAINKILYQIKGLCRGGKVRKIIINLGWTYLKSKAEVSKEGLAKQNRAKFL